MVKFIFKIILNLAALTIAERYFKGFLFTGASASLFLGAFVFALLYTLLRPILKLIFTPIIWITLGLFNVAISMFLLWLADILLPQLTIVNVSTLFWTSLLIGLINAI